MVVPEARGGGTGAGGDGPGARGSAPLTNAAETLRQSSPQLLHLAYLLGGLRLNEVAHLGDTGLQQLPQTGPERSADNGEGARQEGGASSSFTTSSSGQEATHWAREASGELQAPLGPGPRMGGRGRSTWCRGRPPSQPPPPGSFSLLCNREQRGGRRAVGAARPEAGRGRAEHKVREPGVAGCARHRRGEVLSPEFRGFGRKDPRRGTATRPALTAPPAVSAPPSLGKGPRARNPRGTSAPGLEVSVRLGPLSPAHAPAAPPPGRPRAPPPALPTRPARALWDRPPARRRASNKQGWQLAATGTPSHSVGRPPKGKALDRDHLSEWFSPCHERV